MNETPLASRGGPWRRLHDTNITAAQGVFATGGLAAKTLGSPYAFAVTLGLIPVTEIPAGAVPSFAAGEATPNSIMFRFFGDDGNNKSFSARIWGITEGIGTVLTTKNQSWEATLLGQFLITFGNINGVTGTLIDSGSFEMDTIATTYGATSDIVLNSNAADIKGSFLRLDHLAFPLIGVELDDAVNAGTPATAMNALYRFLW